MSKPAVSSLAVELLEAVPIYPWADKGATRVSDDKTAKYSGVSKFFGELANKTSLAAGRATTFITAAGVVVVWAVCGPLFGFSDTWQLVINTGTTIVTFLMVFLIQNSQNRDSAAIQVKLDEFIRVGAARNSNRRLGGRAGLDKGCWPDPLRP